MRPKAGFAGREAKHGQFYDAREEGGQVVGGNIVSPHQEGRGQVGGNIVSPHHRLRPEPDLGCAASDLMGGTMPDTELAQELLELEEADAWFEYLEATRGQLETRYAELEPWAWARLSQRLRAVGARRSRLRPAAA